MEAGKEESLRGLAEQRTLRHFRGGNQDGGYHYSREGFSVERTAPAPLLSCPEPLLLGQQDALTPALGYSSFGQDWTPSPRVTYSGHLLPLHRATSLSWTKEILSQEPEPGRGPSLPWG